MFCDLHRLQSGMRFIDAFGKSEKLCKTIAKKKAAYCRAEFFIVGEEGIRMKSDNKATHRMKWVKV